ncbi:MAG: hypothetical protein WKF75_14770 [Singulisphaera sp.]
MTGSRSEARRRAVQSLGLAESQAELDAVVEEPQRSTAARSVRGR